jgi:hypothetical protein
MATIMIGIALVFILSGREPGWQPYAISGLLGLSFLIAAFAFPNSSQWVGMLAFAVLLIAMFWDRDKPLAAITGIILTTLNVLSARQGTLLSEDGEAKPVDDSSGPVTPTEAG